MGTPRRRRRRTSVLRTAALTAALVGVGACGSPATTAGPAATGDVGGRALPWQPDVRRDPNGRADASWAGQARALASEVAHRRATPLVFLGDSITYRWLTVGRSVWDASFVPSGALDLGIDGDTTQNVLWRIDHAGLAGLAPSRLVLLIGVNDLVHGVTPLDTAHGIRSVAADVRAHLPGTSVLLLEVYPTMGPTSTLRRAVVATDADLARSPLPAGVTLADVGRPLVQADGSLTPGLLNPTDQLHPTEAGYRVLAREITGLLATLPGPTGS